MWEKEDSRFRNRLRETYEALETRHRTDIAELPENRDRTDTANSRKVEVIKIEKVIEENGEQWKANPRLFFEDTPSQDTPPRELSDVTFFESMLESEGDDVLRQCRRRVRCLTYYRLRDKLGRKSQSWRSLPEHFSARLPNKLAESPGEILKKWADAGARYNAIVIALNMDSLFLLPHGRGYS